MIEQINSLSDSRFYSAKDGDVVKLNSRTGMPYFPSVTTILSMLPTDKILIEWMFKFGSHAEYIRYLRHRAAIGTYIHNQVEQSTKTLSVVSEIDLMADIMFNFPEKEDYSFIYGALEAWVNFLSEEEPIILKSEHPFCFEDYAGTIDLKMRIKSDDYKHIWTVDLKSSKQSNDHHKYQVVSYMNSDSESERCAILVLGNTTKTKFTLTKVKPNMFDFYTQVFNQAKEMYYTFNKNPQPKFKTALGEFKTDARFVKLS